MTTQPPRPNFPDPAPTRRGDPLTSYEAAESVKPSTTTELKQTVKYLLDNSYPMTDETIEDLVRVRRPDLTFTSQRLRTVRAQLVKDGWIQGDGKGLSKLGRPATLWTSTQIHLPLGPR